MRVLIAPDKFKGSLSAGEVCAHLATGIISAVPGARIDAVPMADGGEGTLDAAISAGFERVTRTVTGPLGAPVVAGFALRGDRAVIELAAASGLLLIDEPNRRPLDAHTRGTGELMRAALELGARDIVLAVGGSASTDGGTGMLSALGAKFLGADGAALSDGGGALPDLEVVDLSGLDPRLKECEVTLASDVDHTLTGPRGAARVFAPQKGATPAEVALLDRGLARLAAVAHALAPDREDHAFTPGSGAAGGVGFGALAMLGAKQRAGSEVVAEVTGLAALARQATLVITGEGSFDAQSLGGKTPIGVLRVARNAGTPTVLVSGRNRLTAAELRATGFAASFAIADRDPDSDSCMVHAGRHLEQIGAEIGALINRNQQRS